MSVSISGPGSLISDPQGLQCDADCTATFESGTLVGLKAKPVAGAKLLTWVGTSCSGDNPNCFVTLRNDLQLAAQFVQLPAACSDGVKNQDETDVDCGGSCGKCANNTVCAKNSDCESDQCSANVCTICPLDTNLVYNGDAEITMAGDPLPGWVTVSEFQALGYGTGGGYPDNNSPGPAMRGANFFWGGNETPTSASQNIDLTQCIRLNDQQKLKLNLSAYIGGFAGQDDNIVVQFNLRTCDNVTSTVKLGPVLDADRTGATGLLLRTAAVTLPPGICSLQVFMLATRTNGMSNDGYADNVSATLSLQ